MRWLDLRDVVETLDRMGQLTRVDVEVSTDLEVAEITRRVAADDGPALLFTNVADCYCSLATNLLGTERRVCQALDAESVDAVAEPFASRMKKEEFVPPRVVSAAPCQQVVQLGRDIQLDTLPWLRERVAAPQPTLGGALVVTADPNTGQHVLGHYDISVVDRRLLAIRFADRDPIARHFAAYCERGERMPIAVVVGGPPALQTVASGSWDRHLDSYGVASCLSGAAVDVAAGRTIPLQVPAAAELIVEGFVDPEQLGKATNESTGPGDDESEKAKSSSDALCQAITADSLPIEVGMVTHRTQPILTAMVAGGPPDERGTLIRSAARLELPLLKRRHPAIVDLVRPLLAPQQYAFVAMQKNYSTEPRQLAAALWGEASLQSVPFLVLLDAEVDLHDEILVWRQVALHADPGHDVMFPPTGARDDHTSSLAIDATFKSDASVAGPASTRIADAGASVRCQRELDAQAEELRQLVSRRWADYGIETKQPQRAVAASQST